ncbi:MAG: amidohydrolase family protein [Bacilli bacterium]|nr:amidohydrolase family protein [Bacilli bacterium]
MKTLLKNAQIIKMDDSPIMTGDILIENNRIKQIAEEIECEDFDKFIDCKGNIILPGFKNAHAHTAMTFLRGGGKGLKLQDWLFNYCFPREAKLIPSDVYYCSKVGFVEYIQAGITASLDQYFYPVEIGRAAKDIGFRVVLHATFNNYTSKEDLIRLYHFYNSDEDSLVKYQIGLHAEYTSCPEDEKVIGEVLEELKAPFFVHISETKNEVNECFERHGMSPVQYFDSLGFYKYGGSGYHCIYFSDEDIEIYKNKSVYMVTNPGSNQYLESGICPVEKYIGLGFNLAIGTDGPASNYDLDMFAEMRLIHKNQPNIPCKEILKMATANGARAMMIPDCDTLVEGKLADIIMLDKEIVGDKDIYKAIVEDGNKKCVKMTMIDGKVLYKEGGIILNERLIDIYRKAKEVTERINKEVEE